MLELISRYERALTNLLQLKGSNITEAKLLIVREERAKLRVIDAIQSLQSENAELREALETLRDCDWVITLPDRMDAVREIARKALTK